jgi:UrcA family protein
MNKMTGAAIAAALALVAFLSGPAAFAEHGDQPEREVRRVETADLDLTNSQDVEALLSRLRFAAARACGGPVPEVRTPEDRAAYRTCRADALQEAATQTDSPAVDAAIATYVASLQRR